MSRYLFDELPTDMIYWEIFPYLDYNSRVTANLMLPPQDRLRIPLKKDAALQFQMRRSLKEVMALLDKQNNSPPGRQRNTYTLRLWRQFQGRHKHLLQHSEWFRATILTTATRWLDPAFPWPACLSPYTRKTLVTILTNFRTNLDRDIPFVREVSYRGDDWAAVRL